MKVPLNLFLCKIFPPKKFEALSLELSVLCLTEVMIFLLLTRAYLQKDSLGRLQQSFLAPKHYLKTRAWIHATNYLIGVLEPLKETLSSL